MEPNCKECKHFKLCYPILEATGKVPEVIITQVNAVRKRDLCCNNDKYLYNVSEEEYNNEQAKT